MNYIKPKTTVIKVETQTLLAGSSREGADLVCGNVCCEKEDLRKKLFPDTEDETEIKCKDNVCYPPNYKNKH